MPTLNSAPWASSLSELFRFEFHQTCLYTCVCEQRRIKCSEFSYFERRSRSPTPASGGIEFSLSVLRWEKFTTIYLFATRHKLNFEDQKVLSASKQPVFEARFSQLTRYTVLPEKTHFTVSFRFRNNKSAN